MEGSKICLKIYYKDIVQHTCNISISQSKIILQNILVEVNKVIEKKRIQQFLDIQIKIQGDWKNVMDYFMVESLYGQPTITLRLHEDINDFQQKQKIKEWQNKIKIMQQRSDQIYKKVLKDIEKVEDDTRVDLAFFYSQPLLQKINGKQTRKTVSFLKQTRGMSDELQKITKQIRSANIQIAVANQQNLHRILSKGVKILHFSCHGTKDFLEIQQSSDNLIGIAQQISCKQLLQILSKYKQPQIIVFNACLSHKIGQQIYKIYTSQDKSIVTVGYRKQVYNKDCQQFTKKFYSNIFNGRSIQKSAQQSKVNNDIQINYQIQHHITFKPSGISQQNKLIQIKNKTQINKLGMAFPKIYLFNFINKLIKDQKVIVHLVGPTNIGKTQFTQKSLSYIWQRNVIGTYLIVDLRKYNYEVANTIDFRCRIKEQLYPFIQKNGDNNFIVAIDHCDSLIKYQLNHFKQELKKLQQKLKNNKKILIISRQHVPIIQNVQKFILNSDYNIENKLQKNLQIKTQQQLKMREFIQSCYLFVNNSINFLPPEFLAQLFIVNIFSQNIYNEKLQNITNQKQNQPEDMQTKCQQIIEKLRKQISQNVGQKYTININQIIEQMYLIAGVQIIINYNTHSYSKHLPDRQKMYKNIIHTVHKLINICLMIDKLDELQVGYIARQECKQFKIKMYFLLYGLLKNEEDKQLAQIVRNILQEQNQINGDNLIQLLDLNQKCKQYYKSKLSKREQTVQINLFYMNFESYNKVCCYFNLVQMIHTKIIKNQQKQKSQQNNFINIKNYKFYEYAQVKWLLLPVLYLLKQYIIYMNERIKLQQLQRLNNIQKVKEITERVQAYRFLQKNNDLFSRIYQNQYAEYLETVFQLQKLKLNYQRHCGFIDKFQSAKKINQMISKCQELNLQNLKSKIEEYKSNTFNLFISMVSFSPYKIYKYENKIIQMLGKCFKTLGKQIFFKHTFFSIQNLNKYHNINISIPIALFMVDLKTLDFRRKHILNKQLYFCLQNYGKSIRNENQDVQGTKIIELSQVKFFQCGLLILCGEKVSKIPMQCFPKKVSAIIVIETCKQNESKKHFQEQIQQKFHIVLSGQIISHFITLFYTYLCEMMFKNREQRYKNKKQQISKSFQNAKLLAKVGCFNKFGIYNNEVKDIVNRVSLNLSDGLVNEEPIKLGNNTQIFENEYNMLEYVSQHQRQRKITKHITYSMDTNHQIGYCKQLIKIMQIIHNIRQNNNKKINFIFLKCKLLENQTFLHSVCLKIKRIWPTQVKLIHLKPNNLEQVVIQNQHQDHDKIEIYDGSDFSEKQINTVQQFVTKQYLRLLQCLQKQNRANKFINLRIFVFKFFLNFQNQDLNAYSKLFIDKLKNQNLIPILCKKKLQKKLHWKENSINWQQKFFKDMSKKISQKVFQMDQFSPSQQNKIDHALDELLK